MDAIDLPPFTHALAGTQSYYEVTEDSFYYRSTCLCGQRSEWTNSQPSSEVIINVHVHPYVLERHEQIMAMATKLQADSPQ